MGRIAEFRKLYTDQAAIEATLDRLADESYLSPEEADRMKSELPRIIHGSEYVLFNLSVHLSIGAVFAFDIIPIPMGTISRCVWVIGNRAYFEITRNDKRKIHTIGVLGISAIPWLGYFAYLLPLKKVSEDAAYIFANHMTYSRFGMPLERYLEGRRGANIVRRVLIPARLRNAQPLSAAS